MTAAKTMQLVSVETYLTGEELSQVKHEYLGGRIYAMAGASTPHNRVASACHGSLYNQLRGKPCEAFTSDMKVRLRLRTHTRFYYPDVMVVCKPNPEEGPFQDHPVVIAEVISTATRRVDEGEKLEAYLTLSSLVVYMLIETKGPRVVVHRRTNEGFVAELYEGLDAIIPLDVIQARIALAELYERVQFSAESEGYEEVAF